MKVEIEVTYYEKVEIDLEDYGHDETTKWTDLNQDEINEILDPLRENKILNIGKITFPESYNSH